MYQEKNYSTMASVEVDEVDTAVPSGKSEFELIYNRLYQSIMEARETNIHIRNQIATILGEDHLDATNSVRPEPTGLLDRLDMITNYLEDTNNQSQENLNILRRLF